MHQAPQKTTFTSDYEKGLRTLRTSKRGSIFLRMYAPYESFYMQGLVQSFHLKFFKGHRQRFPFKHRHPPSHKTQMIIFCPSKAIHQAGVFLHRDTTST